MFHSRFSISALLACCFLTAGVAAQPQAPTPQRSQPQSTSGRYQLLESHNVVYMIDSATGRVWRETVFQVSEKQIDEYIEKLLAAEEARRGRPFTVYERSPRWDGLRKDHDADIKRLGSPCTGVAPCFVELDRIRLKEDGTFSSEVIKR